MAENDESRLSRRTIVGGMTTGLVAALAPSVLAQRGVSGDQALNTNPQTVKQNPTTEYVHPPFPPQHQDWPGLATRMQPKPDHGEASYKGSGRLAGRKALITGADSGIGRATAIAYAREGADVALNYLPAEEPDAREVVDLIREPGGRRLRFQETFEKKRSAEIWWTRRFGSWAAWISS